MGEGQWWVKVSAEGQWVGEGQWWLKVNQDKTLTGAPEPLTAGLSPPGCSQGG